MLQGRLTAVVAAVTLTACSGSGGAIEENVVRPGITAITEDAPAAACTANLSIVRQAVEAYTLLEGTPPGDEQALIDAEFLREATTDWDVVDGEIVPQNPACGEVPEPVATVDIVTDTERIDPDDFFASFDQTQIDAVGGEECAREFAAIVAGAENYFNERGTDPGGFRELVDTGYLAQLPTLWALVDEQLVPADGSDCADLTE